MIGKEKLAQMDDDYCRSIGGKPGTDSYMQCRMFKTSQRDAGHQMAFRRAGAGLAGVGASMQANAAYQRPVTCTSTGSGTFVNGPVTQVRTTCN